MNHPSATFVSCTLCTLIAIAGAGCTVAGPESIRSGRAKYNMAIQQTNNEQHLLNIVRLKYRDTPYHLEVSNVAAQMFLETSGAASASLPEAALNTFGLSARVEYTERPTISYSPLRGERFVEQLLSPVDIKVILLMYHSGWSIDRVMRLCVQRIGDVPNAPSASGPTPVDVPEFKDFREITATLRELQKDDLLKLGRAEQDGTLRIVIDRRANDRPDVVRMRSLLGLAPDQAGFDLTESFATPEKGQVAVLTRSVIGIYHYLCQGVEVPAEAETLGLVTVTRRQDGSKFDWDELNGDIFNVQSSERRPALAAVAVEYRGRWFSIEDNDLDSKSTFSMLMQLFALQSGDLKTTGPVLTLPLS